MCARRTQSAGWYVRGYEAGVAAGVLAGVVDVLDESDVLGVALEVDAGVVLLEVDLLSVL